MTPRSRPLALLAAVTLAAGATAASCEEEPSGVDVGEVRLGAVTEIVDAPATVTARSAATLTAASAGTLRELLVRPGDAVRPGQVLAVIDSPEATARLDSAARTLDAAAQAGGQAFSVTGLDGAQRETDAAAADSFAAARAAAAKVADERVRDTLLHEVDAAQQRYDAASAAVAGATRSVQAGVAGLGTALGALSTAQRLQAEAAYDLAKGTVDALTLRAPIGGVVQLGGAASGTPAGLDVTDILQGAELPTGSGPPAGVDPAVPKGGYVGAGTTVLTIVDVSEPAVVAEVDETDVLLVAEGAVADVELDAAPGAGYPGEVTSVDLLPTESARGGVSYRVRITLGAGTLMDGRPAPAPRPGMSAVAHLRVREAANTVTVPAAAVFSTESGGEAVWVVDGGRAARVDVSVGVQGQDAVQIVRGLRAGQTIVVRGTDRVTDGQRVP
ncbi:multidrug efflux pump subunit AcrA (membrane-fusion protein) [Catenuloplanes nepalensis]|uniref:Multidrug efflux pump subunit AcrA (Membrane-fusion protein) n=1 Tax=Catenuloplanes nepalensis TaxID=587533 RepID=A0ABT9N368_9ACTN|nr:efflux RND transporter periplasmic adaptor subunit [Catenuloplanes nepalensis]MDP9798000.1 multidrug efflux pump subunit AcrA (membrane-fusion protein) [Catenuloplanes nepalensis]